jgi:hypothetical protein
MGLAVEAAFIALICVDIKLFVALGATETVLVPDALLGFDLFHLKDGLLAGSAIGSVNLGAIELFLGL